MVASIRGSNERNNIRKTHAHPLVLHSASCDLNLYTEFGCGKHDNASNFFRPSSHRFGYRSKAMDKGNSSLSEKSTTTRYSHQLLAILAQPPNSETICPVSGRAYIYSPQRKLHQRSEIIFLHSETRPSSERNCFSII